MVASVVVLPLAGRAGDDDHAVRQHQQLAQQRLVVRATGRACRSRAGRGRAAAGGSRRIRRAASAWWRRACRTRRAPTRTRAAPSCGRRRSAMLRPARILMREISAGGSTPAGVGTARSRPSTRMRTTRPVRNGSMWMSVARSSIARSSRSLTARTTGAPLARSRRLSTSSSSRASRGVVGLGRRLRRLRRAAWSARSRCPRRRRSRSATGPPSTISAARTRRDVVRIGEREAGAAVGALIGEHQGLAQEAARELRRQRRRGDQLWQGRCRGKPVEARDLVGEVVRRKIARLPKVSQRSFAVSARRWS